MEAAKESFSIQYRRLFFQMTAGCGGNQCRNAHCKSSPEFSPLTLNEAAAQALRLLASEDGAAVESGVFCISMPKFTALDLQARGCTPRTRSPCQFEPSKFVQKGGRVHRPLGRRRSPGGTGRPPPALAGGEVRPGSAAASAGGRNSPGLSPRVRLMDAILLDQQVQQMHISKKPRCE